MWMERADAWQLYINFWCVLVLGRVPYWPESVRKETQKERKWARVVVERQFINCLWLLELKAQSNRKQKIILKIDSSGCFSSPSCQALASLTRITYHWELFQRYLKVSAQVKDTKKTRTRNSRIACLDRYFSCGTSSRNHYKNKLHAHQCKRQWSWTMPPWRVRSPYPAYPDPTLQHQEKIGI